jgi:hypothetical protein
MQNDFIIEVWSRLKPLIPAKDRLDGADAVVAVCDEFGILEELEHHEHLDNELTAALRTQLEEEYPDEDEEPEEY